MVEADDSQLVRANVEGVRGGTSGANAPPPSILIVDDSSPLRRMLIKIISGIGYRTHEACDGTEALELLGKYEAGFFSLILLDLMMPKMNGATFIRVAMRDHRQTLPPIVVCSSRSDRETIESVVKMGVQGYLLKPFTTQNVVAKIAEFLPRVAAKQMK